MNVSFNKKNLRNIKLFNHLFPWAVATTFLYQSQFLEFLVLETCPNDRSTTEM